jgi:hypothetical protein
VHARLGVLLALPAILSACAKGVYVPDGAPARPLTQFSQLDVKPLAYKIPGKGDAADPSLLAPPSNNFLQRFRTDLSDRVHKKKVFFLRSGPLLVLKASLLKYECATRAPGFEGDTMTNHATIEIEVVLLDDAGKQIGAGKAATSYPGSTVESAMKGAEKKIIQGIAEYLRKSAHGNAPDPSGGDDPPEK